MKKIATYQPRSGPYGASASLQRLLFLLTIIFISCPLALTAQEDQELPKIVIVDLEPTGALKQSLIEKQAESIASILENSMFKFAEQKYGRRDDLKASATISPDGDNETLDAEVSADTVEEKVLVGDEEESRRLLELSDGAEIVIDGDTTVSVSGNVQILFDNSLKKDIASLLVDIQKSSLATDEALAISDFLRTEIKNTGVFSIVEREQVKNIIKERQLELTGITESDNQDLLQLGKLAAAERILLGSVGRLYGKIIVTTRLVDVSTGEVLFANNIYTEEEDLEYYVKQLARDIAEKGVAQRRSVSLDEIKSLLKKRDYRSARQFLTVYLQHHPADAETQSMNAVIYENLSRQNYREAKTALRKQKFQLARDLINEAIAVNNDERYFDLRNTIDIEEEKYLQKEKEQIERQKQLEEERRERRAENEAIGFTARAQNYYQGITVNGLLLGPSYMIDVSDALELTLDTGKWGGELLYTGEIGKRPNPGNTNLNWMSYIGLNCSYVPDNGTTTLLFRAYLGPFLSWAVKIGNFALQVGFDGGGMLWWNNNLSAANGLLFGATGGALGLVQIKVYKGLGIYAGIKADYLYFPADTANSGPALRFLGGLTVR